MRLNGWQRLWILMSVLYFVPVAWLAWDGLPSRRDIVHDQAWELLDSMAVGAPGGITSAKLRSEIYPNLDDAAVVDSITATVWGYSFFK